MSKYNIEKHSAAVSSIRFNVAGGWEQWFLLTSDNHHDSVFCNRELEKKHLEFALERNALILNFGDFFDAMQGRFDPRRSMNELRPEYRREDYYDFVVQDCAEFLRPYARNIALMSRGNHEMSIRKLQSTDLTERLTFLMSIQNKTRIITGGYGGWIVIVGVRSGKTAFSYRIKYFHGAGGNAPVTRGVIQTNRQATYLPDADAVINGHNHAHYIVPITRERINQGNVQYYDIQHHVRVPGYKQSYNDGTAGWDVMRGAAPQPIGAVWLKMSYIAHELRVKYISEIEGPKPTPGIDTIDGAYEYPDDAEYP